MKHKVMLRLWTLFLVLLGMACSACGDDFDPASRVENLRVLAVQADKPFAKPGEDVTLRALYHDPEGRTLSWAFGTCAGYESTTALACAQTLDFDSLTVQGEPSHVLQVPETRQGAPLRTGDVIGVVVMACPGTISQGDTSGIPVRCVDASGDELGLEAFELGVKRIFVHEQQRNANPEIAMILWDGERWPEGEERQLSCSENGRCKRHTLEVRAAEAQDEAVDASAEKAGEQHVVQFYATGGSFEDDVRTLEDPETTFRARPEDKGKLLTMWFVLRDDRGGVSWSERQVRVR